MCVNFCIDESKLAYLAGAQGSVDLLEEEFRIREAEITSYSVEKTASAAEEKRARVVRCIRGLPSGMVSSYGAIASAAGWAGAARQVVRILREVPGLPWHRVLGSGGAVKLGGENGAEQRFRLRMEGVTFRGARVDMKRHEFRFAKPARGKRR
jgi:methylated-DNA-protein-cysteine methyltransferase-like protein